MRHPVQSGGNHDPAFPSQNAFPVKIATPCLLSSRFWLQALISQALGCGLGLVLGPVWSPTTAQAAPEPNPPAPQPPTSRDRPPDAPPLDLDPQLIQASPVLQRWLKAVPNVLDDIENDPSFRTRLRLGYSQYPTANHASGIAIGLRDVFLGQTRLTLNADYQTAWRDRATTWGTDLHYYLRPLGKPLNIAPILGFQHVETARYTTEGLNVGLKLLVVPSRTGAADLSLSQTWIAPGTPREVGLTTLSLGYALTPQLRIATDIQAQNAPQHKDSRVSLVLEWMF
jgi:hypothetical protein